MNLVLVFMGAFAILFFLISLCFWIKLEQLEKQIKNNCIFNLDGLPKMVKYTKTGNMSKRRD
jgi:uncharacterized protein YneF (UPF0154 family)